MSTETAEMVETYKALKVVNLGWCIRQPGDFVHEYTPENMKVEGITERTLERLVRLRYVERRTVLRAELEAAQEKYPKRPEEVPEAPEGESSQEEPEEPVETDPEAPEPIVEEELIDDLGPVEEEPEEEQEIHSQVKKKVVRRRGGN